VTPVVGEIVKHSNSTESRYLDGGLQTRAYTRSPADRFGRVFLVAESNESWGSEAAGKCGERDTRKVSAEDRVTCPITSSFVRGMYCSR
jgi:hypothetical protein